MAPNGASLLRSIGNVLHLPPSSLTLLDSARNASNHELPIKTFEKTLATRLSSLILQEESQAFTMEWLKNGMQLSLVTNLDAQAFIPEVQAPPSNGDEKWMSKYLDYSFNVLNMCNKIRESIAGIDRILMCVKLILHYVNLQVFPDNNQFDRFKGAVHECSTALKNYREVTHTSLKSNGKNCEYLMEDMPKPHLGAKSEHALRKQTFLVALYAAQVTTSIICSVVVAAFTKAGVYLAEQPLKETFAWSLPLMSLQNTVKAVARKRMDQGLNFIIPELCDLEFCVTKFEAFVDDKGSKGLCDCENELKGELHGPVNNLKLQSVALDKSLRSLENEVDKLFCLTMSNRNSLLDKLKA